MTLPARPRPGLQRDYFVRFLGGASALAPDESRWEDDDPDADWEACDPADEELADADEDLDWWLDDETEEELPPPDDWDDDDEDRDE